MTNTNTDTERAELYDKAVLYARINPSISYVSRKLGIGFVKTRELLEQAENARDIPDYSGRRLDDYEKPLRDRISELEAELEAVGAGGVQRLAAAPQAAVPLFWVRLLRDGLYEGPVHNNSVGGKMLRDEKPGEWHPLYLHAATQPAAQGMEAQELLAALGDLSFACFCGIGTKAPDAATYNRTFAVLQKHRDTAQAKQGAE